LEVNVRYVHDLLKHGIEPKNEEVRVKLFLPRKKRKPRMNADERGSGKRQMAEEERWWRKLATSERRGLIRSLFEIKDSLEEE
jgi:hypothetical protein